MINSVKHLQRVRIMSISGGFFLDGSLARPKERDELFALSSNWVKLHEAMKRGEVDESQTRKMIIIELETRKRPDMLIRMKSHFDRLRMARENTEMFRVLSDGA